MPCCKYQLPTNDIYTDISTTLFFFTDGVNVFGNAQRAAKPPYKNFAPQLFSSLCVFACGFHGHTCRHSQTVNGVPSWCGDCAGQCAPLCDCMPPRLRLSLDTSQPSRPADLYPTVTLSERHREAEREGKSNGMESGMGGRGERMQKVKGCHKVREQIEGRGKRRGRETESKRTCRQERGGWRGEKKES